MKRPLRRLRWWAVSLCIFGSSIGAGLSLSRGFKHHQPLLVVLGVAFGVLCLLALIEQNRRTRETDAELADLVEKNVAVYIQLGMTREQAERIVHDVTHPPRGR